MFWGYTGVPPDSVCDANPPLPFFIIMALALVTAGYLISTALMGLQLLEFSENGRGLITAMYVYAGLYDISMLVIMYKRATRDK